MSILWNVETLVGVRLGSCVLERPLGAGGMGAVYLARQERPRRQVAVKVLRPRSAADQHSWATFLARFRREADATAALDHANIVPIYEFGERDDLAYLVMPYLADGSLAALLARMGPLPLSRAAAYAAQTAAALDHAHRHGIIHRDVKPSNLLLHPDGRLLLADFGIARALDRPEPNVPDGAPLFSADLLDDAALTQAGAVVGTPHYMAPELIRGEPATGATDVYALGALSFTMLAGQPPFGEGGTTVEVLRRQIAGDSLPLHTLRPDAPPAVEDVISAALAPRPNDRPPSAGAFARALRQAAKAKPPSRLVAPSSTLDAASSFVPRSHGRPVDAPTRPRPPGDDRGATRGGSPDAAFHDDATLYDPTGMPTSAPAWPTSSSHGAHHGRGPGSLTRLFSAAAIAAIGAVVLALIVVFVALALAGAPSPGHGAISAAHVLPTPTATQVPTATPSPTPVINWLTVAPTSVSLGCSSKTKAAEVVLRNLGPDQVRWSAGVPWLGGIGVSPGQGTLPTDNSVTITLTNTSIIFGHQGTISFRPTDKRAGQPAALTYATQPC
ncbi:MAG TPA: protein kinase [Ktedonobacterales bacterium]|nr:protein kinase [Ktedonobacterales bacterium]